MLAEPQAYPLNNPRDFSSNLPPAFSKISMRIADMRARRAREVAEINATFAGIDRAAPMPTVANDDDLDAALADLPYDLEHVPAPVVIHVEAVAASSPTPHLDHDLVTRRGSKRRPKTQARDRENRAWRMAYRRSAVSSSSAPLVHPLAEQPTPLSANTNTPQTHSNDNDNDTTKPKRPRKSRTRFHATWGQSGELTRIDYINRAGELHGSPFAWTLNLAPDVEKAANDNERGALDYLARRVRRCLDREPLLQGVALPLWIVIETTAAGRLHLHGAIFVANPELLPAIVRALTKAGGTWDAAAGEGYQTDVSPQRHPDAWSAYPLKRQARTRRHLREAAGLQDDAPVLIATWSRELIAEAKRLLAEERRAIGRR